MSAQLREAQRQYDNQPEPESDDRAFERADQKIRDDELRMAELISDVTDISDDNWLMQALIHAHRTGDWQYVRTQCEKHIEPVIDGAVQKEMERAARSWQ